MSIKGVIFDMDGVLVDTEQFYQKQRLEFLRRMDYAPANTEHLIGSNEPAVWAALVPDISLREKLLMGYRAFRQLHPTPYAQLMNPTTPTLLQCLRTHGIKIGLASSSVRKSVDNMLFNTGIAEWIDYLSAVRNVLLISRTRKFIIECCGHSICVLKKHLQLRILQ